MHLAGMSASCSSESQAYWPNSLPVRGNIWCARPANRNRSPAPQLLRPSVFWKRRASSPVQRCANPNVQAGLILPVVNSAASSRLGYIDWLRGLACVLMFQTHCYDAWLGGAARNSTFFMWSQLGGTFPAPLFLFLAGVSFAIVTGKLLQKGLSAGQIAKT